MSTSSIELEAQLIERTVDKRNEIIARGEEKARRIQQAAEKECERIRAESEKQILNIIGSELRSLRDRIVGRASVEGRKTLMKAREEVLSSVFDDAGNRLREVAEGRDKNVDYGEVLVKLIIESISGMGGSDFVVAANDRDLTYLKRHLNGIKGRAEGALGQINTSLEGSPIDAMGGVEVRNTDGSKIFHNTFEGRLLKARGRIEAKVLKTLGVI
jgi:vacuolar-type H+-ATPase subunit E/Vma4